MTKDTKKLFNAPWQIWGDGCQVCDIRGTERAYCADIKDSARLVCLPALYDALMEAVGRVCFCCTEDRTCGVVQPNPEWFMDNPEFCSVKDCKYKHWWYLLRKVRDGE